MIELYRDISAASLIPGNGQYRLITIYACYQRGRNCLLKPHCERTGAAGKIKNPLPCSNTSLPN